MSAQPVPQAAPTVSVTIAVHDPSTEPVKDDLVIVQNLDDHENEVVRALTDEKGEIPVLQLRSGLYRAIATAPYGIWQTTVREFLVSDTPVRVVLAVEPMPTHGNGDIVLVGATTMSLQVLNPDGKPAAGAAVLARDRNATLYLERWYKTDLSGRVTIEVVGDPLVVVVVSGRTIVTKEFSSKRIAETIRLPQQ